MGVKLVIPTSREEHILSVIDNTLYWAILGSKRNEVTEVYRNLNRSSIIYTFRQLSFR
jgi:hypothetical protein